HLLLSLSFGQQIFCFVLLRLHFVEDVFVFLHQVIRFLVDALGLHFRNGPSLAYLLDDLLCLVQQVVRVDVRHLDRGGVRVHPQGVLIRLHHLRLGLLRHLLGTQHQVHDVLHPLLRGEDLRFSLVLGADGALCYPVGLFGGVQGVHSKVYDLLGIVFVAEIGNQLACITGDLGHHLGLLSEAVGALQGPAQGVLAFVLEEAVRLCQGGAHALHAGLGLGQVALGSPECLLGQPRLLPHFGCRFLHPVHAPHQLFQTVRQALVLTPGLTRGLLCIFPQVIHNDHDLFQLFLEVHTFHYLRVLLDVVE
ncbi:unnamed protein product, partial [Ixodes pacificus]